MLFPISLSCNFLSSLSCQANNHLGPLALNLHVHARNLGVIFDPALKFDKQINSVVKGCFFQLRNITKPFALISSRLDYCNALYLGISQSSLSRLQLVQSAAARLLTGSRKKDSITPVLASLHWSSTGLSLRFYYLFLKLYTAWRLSTSPNSSAPFPTPDLSDPQTSLSWLFLDRR